MSVEIDTSNGRVVVKVSDGLAHYAAESLSPAAALELAERLKTTALAQLRAAPGPCGLCGDAGHPHGCEACGLKRLGLLGVDGQPYYAVYQSRKKTRRVQVEL